MLVWQKKEERSIKGFPWSCAFFGTEYEALQFPPLGCLYQHNKMLYSVLLYRTEGPIRGFIRVSFSAQTEGFSFVYKKKLGLCCVVGLFVSSLLTRAHKDETDNSSEALEDLYWQRRKTVLELIRTICELYTELSIEWSRTERIPPLRYQYIYYKQVNCERTKAVRNGAAVHCSQCVCGRIRLCIFVCYKCADRHAEINNVVLSEGSGGRSRPLLLSSSLSGGTVEEGPRHD